MSAALPAPLVLAFDGVLLLLLAVGSFFCFLGSFSLIKLPTFFQRVHGPTKASTLGVGCLLLASMGYHALHGEGFHPRELMIALFLFLTAPVSAHMMAKAALSLKKHNLPPPAPGCHHFDTAEVDKVCNAGDDAAPKPATDSST